jgi:hypothetical protein
MRYRRPWPGPARPGAKLHLNDESIRAIKVDARTDFWDIKTPAFGVRVGKHSKTFVVKRGNRRITIGRYMSPYKSEDVPNKTNGVAPARLDRIKVLNDNFRRTFTGGQVYLTCGVAALEARKKAQVLEAVRTFTLFNEGNDPHGEHDFASIEVDGENYFFKIDYYDTDIRYGSDDPSDPSCTKRIMTIMLASEY